MSGSGSAAPAVNYGDLFYRYPTGAAREERSEAKTTAVAQAPALDLEEAERFLSKVWECYHPDALCYALVIIGEKGLRFKHFCTDKAECQKPERCAKKWLAQLKGLENAHVYFQVLPLAWEPEKGRGSEKDVLVGQWVFADLDYKSVTEKPAFEGCREGEDHALECYYQESGKWVHVKRPPLSKVLAEVREKLGAEPSIVVDSGAGYHLYFKLQEPLEAKALKPLLEKVVTLLGGDPQSKDLARILRVPGTVNPRVKRLTKVIVETQSLLSPDDIRRLFWEERKEKWGKEEKREERREKEHAQAGGLRELNDSEVLRIVDLVRAAYKPGYRQSLALFLSGWLAKARVSPLSAAKIVKTLHDSTQDEDSLKTRLSAVVYSYKKAGVDLEPYAEEIERLTGVRPYGLDSEFREEAVKGITGLQEILETLAGEEKAIEVIHQLSEILQTVSPWRDMVVFLFDEGKQIYYVADPRRMVIRRAVRREKMVGREVIVSAVPTHVIEYKQPIGGVRKYEVTFEARRANGEKETFTIGPAYIEEIAERLSAEGFVTCHRLLRDALDAIIRAFIIKGKAEERMEIEAPGFYSIEGKLVCVKYDYGYDAERLREALLLLNELAEAWFKHAKEKFAVIIKWGAAAPFNYILKQRGRWLPWLYLFGDSATGKTTLGKIALKLWGLDSRHEKTGASIDTVARLGNVLSMSTFPVMVNEPGGALSKEEIVEMIKNAVENTIARGKYVRGTYTEFPALSALIFTSNKFLPRDDGLLRRMKVITFTYGEKIPLEKQKEFKEKVEPRLAVLAEIGKCIAKRVLDDPDVLKHEPLQLGEMLLAACYMEAGLPVPEWLSLQYEEQEDIADIFIEDFLERFKKHVNDLYARYIQRLIVEKNATQEVVAREDTTLQERLLVLLKTGMLPGVSLKKETVVIKRALLEELGLAERVSLKSLAEMLGMEYTKNYTERVEGRVRCSAAIITPLEQFLALFS